MIIKTARFGTLAVEAKSILTIDNGLLAFEDLTRFLLLDIAENVNFKWLQSIDNPKVAFLLVDPFTIKVDYSVDLNNDLVEQLSISVAEDVLVYTIVTVPKSGFKNATTNLIGPLIINWTKMRAKQIIYEKKDITIRYPIFPNACKKLNGG